MPERDSAELNLYRAPAEAVERPIVAQPGLRWSLIAFCGFVGCLAGLMTAARAFLIVDALIRGNEIAAPDFIAVVGPLSAQFIVLTVLMAFDACIWLLGAWSWKRDRRPRALIFTALAFGGVALTNVTQGWFNARGLSHLRGNLPLAASKSGEKG